MNRRRAIIGGMFSLLALAGVAAGWLGLAGRDVVEWTPKGGVLRIGYAVEPPYAMVGLDGRPDGALPVIAAELAGRVGATRVEWRLSEFGQLVDELESGVVDVVAAGFFITPEREKSVAFSSVVFEVGPGLLVRAGNPRGVAGYESFTDASGTLVAALAGAVEIERLRERGMPDAAIMVVPDAWSGRSLVGAGRADALALSAPSVRWLARPAADAGEPEFEAVVFPPMEARDAGRVAYAFRKRDRRLCAAWDRALAEFMAGSRYREIATRYGFTPLVASRATEGHR